jgi:hypothetical protein
MAGSTTASIYGLPGLGLCLSGEGALSWFAQ